MGEAIGGKATVKTGGGVNAYGDAARCLDAGCTCLGSSKFWELVS